MIILDLMNQTPTMDLSSLLFLTSYNRYDKVTACFFVGMLGMFKGESMKKKGFLILIISCICICTASCGVSEKSDTPENSDTVLIFFPDNRFGLINGSGDIVVQPQYDVIFEFGEGFAGVKVGSKWGFIGKDGKFLIKPRFQYIKGSFSEGLACVMENYKYGYINKQGQWKIKPRFDDADSFHEGIARIEMDGKIGFIDTNGQVVINLEFARVESFSEGLAPAQKMAVGRWGYIDKKGNMVIPPTYDFANTFSEGLAVVEKTIKRDSSTRPERLYWILNMILPRISPKAWPTLRLIKRAVISIMRENLSSRSVLIPARPFPKVWQRLGSVGYMVSSIPKVIW